VPHAHAQVRGHVRGVVSAPDSDVQYPAPKVVQACWPRIQLDHMGCTRLQAWSAGLGRTDTIRGRGIRATSPFVRHGVVFVLLKILAQLGLLLGTHLHWEKIPKR